MTDVTLRVATGYRVSFVDGNNETQLLAQSSDFEVKAAGSLYPSAWALVPDVQFDTPSM